MWALWWILPVLWVLYTTAHRLWPRKPKELSLKDRVDAITLISQVPNSEERKWLTWHWKLATEEGTDCVFRAMPTLTWWQEPEPAPRKVDPVPSSWRTKESTLTEKALWADQVNLTKDSVRALGVFPLVHDLEERIKSEAKSNGGSSRPPHHWGDSVYRSSNPHR